MDAENIKARFALGGITEPMVALHEAGYIEHLFDVQCFDLVAAQSIGKNKNHHEISASQYANPHTKGSVTNKLDIVILSALEIDKDFNVNVMTASDGVLMGASGGHSDTAACAKMTVVVAPLLRGRIPTVVKQVQTVITPGSSVDVLVTDRGISVNPQRTDLIEAFAEKGIELVDINDLVQKAEDIVGQPAEIPYTDKIVGVVEYRDGTWMDVIYG
ncbi:Citrate lyase alpha chain, partial [Aduncisulcus paluster]